MCERETLFVRIYRGDPVYIHISQKNQFAAYGQFVHVTMEMVRLKRKFYFLFHIDIAQIYKGKIFMGPINVIQQNLD